MPWIFLLVFAMLSFSGTVSDDVTIGGSYGNVWKNAPFVAQNWYSVFSIISLLLVVAFLNGAAIRDFENNTDQIVFSSPIHKAGYYFGHFAGALLIALIPMLGVSLGMWLGAAVGPAMGWVDAARFGPFEVAGHLNAYVAIVIPNMIFAGGILYAVAALTRSTMYSFVAAVLLLVGYIIAGKSDARYAERAGGGPARPLRQPPVQHPHEVLDGGRKEPSVGRHFGAGYLAEPPALDGCGPRGAGGGVF